MRRILVEGWRFLPHSYSLVNQFQLLEMLRRPELAIYHTDVPYLLPRWKSARGIFDAATEKRLEQIPPPSPDKPPEVTLRMGVPMDFGTAATPRTVVFGTSEWGTVLP